MVEPALNLEPWNEDATVITMNCHARSGARSLAAAVYRSCADALTIEFGIIPGAQTWRVYDQIRSGAPPEDRDELSGIPGRRTPHYPRRQRPVQLVHPADAQFQLHRYDLPRSGIRSISPLADNLHRDQRSRRPADSVAGRADPSRSSIHFTHSVGP